MRKTVLLLLPFALLACTPVAPPAPPLAGGGFLAGLSDAEPLVVDPPGDGGASGVDFAAAAAAHTPTDLVLYIELGRVVNLQSEPALALTLSAGGGELRYDFAARGGSVGGEAIGHEDIGLVSMPTVTSDRFEIAIRLDAAPGGQPLFVDGAPVSIAFADPNPGGDTVPAFTYAWQHPLPAPETLSTERPEGAVRLVSWNALRDGVLDSRRTEHFERILIALQPDIIAFQEMDNRAAGSVEERIEEWLGGDWHALKQADLVTVSRYPFVEGWTDTSSPLDARIFAQMIDVDGQDLLLFNAHLFCCDADAGRQEQVDGFAAFVRDRVPEGVPFILAGDLNLVGDAAQLHTLLTGDIRDEAEFGSDHPPDQDGTALADLLPRHLFTAHNYTWWDAGSDFAPGRLDYVIFTDSLLQATGFVFDPFDFPAELLVSLGVLAGDAREASDHLPLVADFSFSP